MPSLLLRCRAEKKFSLDEVGQAVGLSGKGVSNIEQGLYRPRPTTRVRIEAFLRQHGYAVSSEAA